MLCWIWCKMYFLKLYLKFSNGSIAHYTALSSCLTVINVHSMQLGVTRRCFGEVDSVM